MRLASIPLGIPLLLAILQASAGGAETLFEAEDRRFVQLRGGFEAFEAPEAQEGGVSGLLCAEPGSTLRFDFLGGCVAVRCFNGPYDNRLLLNSRPTIFAWREFPAAVFKASLDGREAGSWRLASRKGFDDLVVAEALEKGRHSLVITLVEGVLLLDRFVVGDARFARFSAEVRDEKGSPVVDALVELRSDSGVAAAFRTQRDGSTGLHCSVAPGKYSVSAAPDDCGSRCDVAEIVDDPRMPVLKEGVTLGPGKTCRLSFTLFYRDPSLAACRSLLYPSLCHAVLRRPGEDFPLVLAAGLKPETLELVGPQGPIELAARAAVKAPWAEFFPALIPAGTPPGAYGLRARGRGFDETAAAAVVVAEAFPAEYQVAHVSDSHVKNWRFNWSAFNRLRKILEEAASQEPRPLFAFVTGDLTDSGTASEYLRFRSAVARSPLPVTVCEGNHDCFTGGSARFYRGGDEYRRHVGLSTYPFSLDADRYAVLGAGCYEGFAPEEEIFAREFLSGGRALKALVHHFDYTSTLTRKVEGVPSNQMAFLAARCGANLLLEGHLHMYQTRRVASAAAYTAPASVLGEYAYFRISGGRPVSCRTAKIDSPGGEIPEPAWSLSAASAPDPSAPQGVSRARAVFSAAPEPGALARVLGSSDSWEERWAAAYAIGLSGDAKSFREALDLAVTDSNPLVRAEAVKSMAADTRMAPVRATLADGDARVRHAAVLALGKIRGTASLEALLGAVSDPDPRICEPAARLAATFGEEKVLEECGRLLKDRSVHRAARRALVEVLSDFDPALVAPLLAAVVDDQDHMVRIESALALGRLGRREAVPALLGLVEESGGSRPRQAYLYLRKITGRDFGWGSPSAREKWEAWWEEEGR